MLESATQRYRQLPLEAREAWLREKNLRLRPHFAAILGRKCTVLFGNVLPTGEAKHLKDVIVEVCEVQPGKGGRLAFHIEARDNLGHLYVSRIQDLTEVICSEPTSEGAEKQYAYSV